MPQRQFVVDDSVTLPILWWRVSSTDIYEMESG
jgi:hypothetical protein